MENKYFRGILIAFIAISIGLALYTGSFSDSIGQMTKTFDTRNVTVTFPNNGTVLELSACGQKVISGTIINSTSLVVVPTTNYSFSQRPSTTDGYLVATLNATLAGHSGYSGKTVNVSCNYQPRGYIEDAGSRGIVVLIAIFMALLIAVSASPDLREWIKNL